MTETELLPPDQPKLYDYTFTLYTKSSNPKLVTALATCCYIVKENLRDHFKGSGLVYENTSEVVLSNQQVLIVDVQAREVTEFKQEIKPEDQPKEETCVILEASTDATKDKQND